MSQATEGFPEQQRQMVQIDQWKADIAVYQNKMTIENDRMRANSNDLKYSEGNGWVGLSIGLCLVVGVASGATYTLNKRK